MGNTNSTQRDYVLQTARGSLTGIEVVDSQTNRPIYRRFTRIRYALPPRGDARWRKPEALPADWIFSNGNDHPRDYRSFGTSCPQLQMNILSDKAKELVGSAERDTDEDCLFLSIWVPAGGEGPRGGWPVQFDIRGGLQTALPSALFDPVDIFREHKDTPRVIVSVSYRTGIFGFLASEELLSDAKDQEFDDPYVASGNFGLWDIRMALEWTAAHIHWFGGNPRSICVGGYGLLVAHQLHFDAYQPVEKRLIHRAYLLSGAVCIQPAIPQSTRPRAQFAELCRKLNIDSFTLPAEDSVRLLRGVSAEKLLQVAGTLQDGFKPVTDGHGGFVPTWFMQSIWNGELGKRLKERGVQILIGDCSGEGSVYEYFCKRDSNGKGHRFAAAINRRQDLVEMLSSFYPEEVVPVLMAKYEKKVADWSAIYRDIMADIQSHVATRGFAHSLFKGGMTTADVLRYHIAWRPKIVDKLTSPAMNMNHSLEPLIWWYSGWRADFSPRDKQDVRNFVRPFARFFQGDISRSCRWGTEVEGEVRRFDPDGIVLTAEDRDWRRALDIWNAIRDAQLQRQRPGHVVKSRAIGSHS